MSRLGSMGIPGLMIVTSLLLFGSSIMAQTSASLVGTVMDASSGAGLQGAMISVVGMEIDDAITDADGRFLLPHLSAGQISLRIALSGYSSVVESIDISSMETALVQILLPRIDAVLDELLVIGRGQGPRTGAAIAEVSRRDDSARTAMDLLEQKVPGVLLGRSGGDLIGSARIRIRGSSSFRNNDPAIYLDGIRVDDGGLEGYQGIHVLELIPADHVERIRILRGPSAEAAYADATNGVILVETRRLGQEGDRPDRRDGN